MLYLTHARLEQIDQQAPPPSRARRGKAMQSKIESWSTVRLAPRVANQVRKYTETADTSFSKVIAALMRLGLEGQENRKQVKERENLVDADPKHVYKLVMNSGR